MREQILQRFVLRREEQIEHKSAVRTEGYLFRFLSSLHFGQYQLPFGFAVKPTQGKWNHSIGQSELSHPDSMMKNSLKTLFDSEISSGRSIFTGSDQN